MAVKLRGAKGVARHAVALMFSTVASAVLGMLFWVVGARFYDVAELGRTSSAVSAITLLGGLAQLSLPAIFIRFLPVAGRSTSRFIAASYLASGSLAVILSVGFFVLGPGERLLPSGQLALVGFCLAVVFSCFSGLQDSVLTALRRTNWVPAENIVVSLGKLGLLPVLAGTAVSAPLLLAWGVPLGVVALALTAAIFLWLAPAHARRRRRRESLPNWREFLAFAGAQNLNSVLSSLALYLPPLLVNSLLGPSQAGLFYVPWLIGTTLNALSWNILVSVVVEATTDPSQIRAQLRHAFRLLLLVTIGGGAVLALGAPLILQVLGAKYVGGVTTLRLIGLALPCGIGPTLFGVTGFVTKRVWPVFYAQLASTVLFLGGTVVALTRLHVGAAGAAGAFLGSEAVMALVLLPATLRGLREVVRISEERVASQDTMVIPRIALEQATVSRLSPSYDAGPMQVVFLPASVIDWDRLGQFETAVIQRVGEPVGTDGESWYNERTIPLRPVLPGDATVPLPRVAPDGSGGPP